MFSRYYVDIGPLSRYYMDMCPLSKYCVDMCPLSKYCVNIYVHTVTTVRTDFLPDLPD